MADDRREALLVANRLSQLAESPIRGSFDLAHLQAIHAHVFQDLPHHRPGALRGDRSSASSVDSPARQRRRAPLGGRRGVLAHRPMEDGLVHPTAAAASSRDLLTSITRRGGRFRLHG
jgi:hypothetical protein